MLTDTHCHLFMEPLSEETDAVLARAAAAGVGRVVVPAYDRASWEAVAELSGREGVHGALGLHPWRAEDGLDPQELETMLRETGAVAVGEVGLDSKTSVPMELQMRVLEEQLELAHSIGLPVILHCRGAFGRLRQMLARHAGAGGLRGVMHAWSRAPETARRFLDLGLHLALGGAVTRPGAERARASAPLIPEGRLLLETDAPSIGLDGVPSGESEPAHVALVAEAAAGLRGATPGELARLTSVNAASLFGLAGGTLAS